MNYNFCKCTDSVTSEVLLKNCLMAGDIKRLFIFVEKNVVSN